MRWFFLLLAVVALAFASGCASTQESENTSVRPWNSPKGWENGLPAGMTEGR